VTLDDRAVSLDAETRARTLAHFEKHRRAWDANAPLRTLYGEWYGRIAGELPPASFGPRVELGSGPGLARAFIPDLELTDLVKAPWHDREVSAEAMPYADASLGGIVLFDVLHHIPSPRAFFAEATRALRTGGRIVMCEPYVSPLSYPIYKFLHDEPLLMRVDPLDPGAAQSGSDPFDSNQAIPTVLFGRARPSFEGAFPALTVRSVERLAGPSYAATGGFARPPFLPQALWSLLHGLEQRLPEAVFGLVGFRMLVTIEKR
jgi:SAM-dependent methyltransferase